MAGGSYSVEKAEACPRDKDTSFKSCMCALFIVLGVCLFGLFIITLLRVLFRPDDESVHETFENEQQNQDYTTRFITKLTTLATTKRIETVGKSTLQPITKITEVTTTSNGRASDYYLDEKRGTTIQEAAGTATVAKKERTTASLKQEEEAGLFTTDSILETNAITEKDFSRIPQNSNATQNGFTNIDNETLVSEGVDTTTPKSPTTVSIQFHVTKSGENTEEVSSENTEIYTTNSDANATVGTTENFAKTNYSANSEINSTIGATNNYYTTNSDVDTRAGTTQNFTEAVYSTISDGDITKVSAETFYSTNSDVESVSGVTQNFAQSLKSIAFSAANDVCESPSCKSAASDILRHMNHSVDPCDDFYKFACGRFTRSKNEKREKFLLYINRINDNSLRCLKEIKLFFDSCVSHESEFLSRETIREVRQLVDNVGELQIDNIKDVSVQELSELLARLVLRQSVPFLDIDLSVHSASGVSSYILQLTLPQHSASEWSSLSENRRRCLRLQLGKTYGNNLNLTEIYEAFLECQKDYSVYLDSVENVIRTLGLLESVKNDSQLLGTIKEIRFTVEDILKILETLPTPYEVRRSLINQDKVVMTLADLTHNFPQTDWATFLSTLTPNTGGSVEVFLFSYFAKTFQELSTLGRKKVYNALLAIYAQDVYSNVVFEPVTSNREDFCAERTSDLFPDLVNYVYKINERNLDLERNVTSIIFNKLKSQLSWSLDNSSSWMESDAILQFQAKLSKFKLRFSENSDFDAAELENKYQNISMEKNAFVKNLEKAMVARRQHTYLLWGEKFKDKQVFQTLLKPLSKHPLSVSDTNYLYIPDEMLDSIHEDRPFYLSMPTVGWRLAKALSRIFDPINVKSILPKSSTYNSLVESTKEQLKHVNEVNFNGHNIILNWNGSLSVNERIVDNTAFRLLLDASQPDDSYNELPLPWISLSYSREKIVFVSAIQEFCEETPLLSYMERIYESENLPASLMAENVLINSQSFATTFDCKPGSSMNIFEVRYQFPYLEKVEDYNNYEYEISN